MRAYSNIGRINNMQSIREDLLEINEIEAYLDKLNEVKNDFAILLAVKDTAGSNMSDAVLGKLKQLGFESISKQLWVMYAGAICNGEKIVDTVSKKTEERVEIKFEFNNYKFDLTSEAWKTGNRAAILVNGIDFACNRRGINIVVYDTKNDTPVDSIYYDSHQENDVFSRDLEIIKKKNWITSDIKRDVCIVGFWYGANYGSLLNGYAIYRIIKDMNKSVLLLQKPDSVADDIELRKKIHNTNFIEEVYNEDDVSPRMSRKDLQLLDNHVDTFIAGSDQIWNYRISFSGLMYIPFSKKRKISFCTSLGSKDDHVAESNIPFVRSELEKYNAISVREDFSAKTLKRKYGINSEILLEPVFDIEKNIYDELIEKSNFEESEPYIVAYILDPNEEKLNALLEISGKLDKKIITIADGYYTILKSSWEHCTRKENYPNLQVDMEVKDFLKAFSNAEFVITDSFHGTCFSIIFEKRFISFCNPGRGAERFGDILGRFNLMNRLVDNVSKFSWKDEYEEFIEYDQINKIIKEDREKSVGWLKNELRKIDEIDNAITQNCNMNLCVGCGACSSICPNDAITMKGNDLGYYKPIVNIDKCSNCGICSKICPVINNVERENSDSPKCYEIVAANDVLLKQSSSGGAFSLLAHEIFKKGGCVFGAAWKDDFTVEHIMIDTEDDMYKLRKSKYLQSYLGNTFRKVKEKLLEGKPVLFSGCPCQAAGLRQYLGKKEYENLVIVDLLCGNAPSSKFFKKYVQESYGEDLVKYEFRNKTYGWNSETVKLTFKDGSTKIIKKACQSDYQRVYHNHAMCSYHCEHCKYQNVPKIGDITIGDFWWINNFDKEVEYKNGISALLVNSKKGQALFDAIEENKFKVRKEVPFQWLKGNGFTVKGTHNFVSPKRDLFYDAIQTMPFTKAVNYALKPNHGNYDNTPLFFNSRNTVFSYDNKIWEEHVINGTIYLFTKLINPPTRRYAIMQMKGALSKETTYELHIKFKVISESQYFNLHIKDSGSMFYQVIWTEKIDNNNRGKWIERKITFTPDADIYDEFMIGAAQLVGNDANVAFSLIDIHEVN